jgi:hypothetical protein
MIIPRNRRIRCAGCEAEHFADGPNCWCLLGLEVDALTLAKKLPPRSKAGRLFAPLLAKLEQRTRERRAYNYAPRDRQRALDELLWNHWPEEHSYSRIRAEVLRKTKAWIASGEYAAPARARRRRPRKRGAR